LYPIPVDNPSFNPTFVFATDATTQKIMVTFDFDRLFDESTMYMITPLEAGVNFNDLTGLIDVMFVLDSALTATQVGYALTLEYGTALNPIQFIGAVAGDFQLVNETTMSGVAITVLEGPAGIYLFTFVAQTAGDEMILSVAKDGFDGEITFVAV
jgi:hypothetical protein